MEKDKFLIWFVCFGNQIHKEMTFFSILSIINYTNYSGEIIVLSDTDQFTTNIDRVKVINVKNKYKKCSCDKCEKYITNNICMIRLCKSQFL